MLEQGAARRSISFALEGDIDMASVPAIAQPLFDILERGECSEMQVDCSGISFIDARGLSMMARAQRIADESGCRLMWMDPSAELLKILSIAGMYEYLTISVSP
jgi:anti-sigma B factor antagonist